MNSDPNVRVRNLRTALRETPAERRARELFWVKHFWRQAVRRYKRAKLEAAEWRAVAKGATATIRRQR